MGWGYRLLPVLAGLSALILAGCGGSTAPTAEAMNASYEQALARTAAVAVESPDGDEGARRAIAAAGEFFRDMLPDAVRARALATYAPDAYLNDNIAIVEGSAAIGEYFARTVARVQSLQVAFLDVTHTGPDYFVRWRMTVQSDRLNDGQPMVSYGVTHFRFDARGRILMHKDFWDAGTGLHEYIPGVRSILRRVRAAAESE